MRASICAIIVSLLFVVSSHSKAPTPQTTPIRLVTTVLKEEYCASDHLRLRLRFRFTNLGSDKVILFKYGTAITREMFSRSDRDALNGKYVHDVQPFVQPVISELVDTAVPSETLFIVLRTGESYELDHDFHVFVSNRQKDGSDGLRSGKYFLQLEVPTWWWGEKKAAILRERWRPQGSLYTEKVTSSPMAIKIENSPTMVKCQ